MTKSHQKERKNEGGLFSTLKDGITAGFEFLENNQRELQHLLSTVGLDNTLDIGKWTQNLASHPNMQSNKKRNENILELLKEFSQLKDSLMKGNVDYEKVGNFIIRSVDYVAENPELLTIVLNVLAKNVDLGPVLGDEPARRIQELIETITSKISDGLKKRESGKWITSDLIISIANSILKSLVDRRTYERSEPIINPLVDIGYAIYDMAIHWNDDHSANPNRRSAYPDVTDVFLEILKEPIHKLTIALRSAEETAEMLEDMSSTEVTGSNRKKRDVGKLASAVRKAAVRARKLKSWSYSDTDYSLTYSTFKALPSFEQLVRDLRDDSGVTDEARTKLQNLATDVEDSIDRLVRMKRMINHIKDWNGKQDLVTLVQDVRDIIGGISRFNLVSISLNDLLRKLKSINA